MASNTLKKKKTLKSVIFKMAIELDIETRTIVLHTHTKIFSQWMDITKSDKHLVKLFISYNVRRWNPILVMSMLASLVIFPFRVSAIKIYWISIQLANESPCNRYWLSMQWAKWLLYTRSDFCECWLNHTVWIKELLSPILRLISKSHLIN